jgi:carboxyl-terminal processing protease
MDNKRALVLGTRTYGKGSVQQVIPLDDNNGELKLTMAYYYLPSGRLVHRTKDSTDWGVDPQIVVPMDDVAQRAIVELHLQQEIVRKPLAKPVTPANASAAAAAPATMPSTQPVDIQLQQAVNTMVGLIILNHATTAPAIPPEAAAAPLANEPAPAVTAPPTVAPPASDAQPPATPPSPQVAPDVTTPPAPPATNTITPPEPNPVTPPAPNPVTPPPTSTTAPPATQP